MKRPLRPASRLGWWAFGLTVATVVWGVLFPSLVGLLGAAFGGATGRRLPIPVGLTSATLELVLALAALATGIIALRKGERSWLTLLAFVPAVLVGGFWILFALGEVLWPH
jgi:hypothetical protein